MPKKIPKQSETGLGHLTGEVNKLHLAMFAINDRLTEVENDCSRASYDAVYGRVLYRHGFLQRMRWLFFGQ
jgi:hypothetical protein